MDLLLIIYIIFILFLLFFVNKLIKKSIKSNEKQKLNCAVIVEPRKDQTLIKVITNFLELLPKETIIYIFHGIENEKYIKENFINEINNGKIIMYNLNKKNLTINDYNLLLTSKNFYNKINGENILIFQMDTCLCSNTKYKFEDFLNYDYIGAPWVNQNFMKYEKDNKIYKVMLKNKVGNGGLSLRKKSKIIKHIETHKYNGEPEDVYFSKSNCLNFPSIHEASNFSSEHLFNAYSIGFHKPKELLNKEQKNKLIQTCPDYFKVFE